MEPFTRKLFLFQSGLIVVVGLLAIMMCHLITSRDSFEKPNNTLRLLHPPSKTLN